MAAKMLKKACPRCNTQRLWCGPPLGARGKVYCLECGATYQLKK